MWKVTKVSEASKEKVRNAKTELANALRDVAGITSLGIGKIRATGDYCVRVTVQNEATAKRVPKSCQGVPVEVSVSGDFFAY